MVFGNNFTFNNKNSSNDFSVIMVSFEESRGFETSESLHKVESTIEQVGNNPYFHLINQKYEEPITFRIGIAKEDGKKFTKLETRNIAKWLTVNEYTKLEIDNEKYSNIFFMSIVTNIETQIINDNNVGFVITFQCDSPFGYEYIENTYTVNGTTNISVNNTTDNLLNNCYVKPLIIIEKNNITEKVCINNTTTHEVMEFSQVLALDEITCDCANMVLKSSVQNHNLYNYFNRVWLRFAEGINNITVIGNCTITLKYNIPRKVAIL